MIVNGTESDGAVFVCDKFGRVWVGHLNHRVSVYDGLFWKNSDAPDGPLGERVFAMTTSPTDGDVWGSAGPQRRSMQTSVLLLRRSRRPDARMGGVQNSLPGNGRMRLSSR